MTEKYQVKKQGKEGKATLDSKKSGKRQLLQPLRDYIDSFKGSDPLALALYSTTLGFLYLIFLNYEKLADSSII